jgi:hypothetical protein
MKRGRPKVNPELPKYLSQRTIYSDVDYSRVLILLGYRNIRHFKDTKQYTTFKADSTVQGDIVAEFNDLTDYYLPRVEDKNKPLVSVTTGEVFN